MAVSCGILDELVHRTPVAVVDFETTGLTAGPDRVIEVSVVRIEPGHEPHLDPNTAEFHDSLDMLGPIQIRPPADSRLPFFGLARLPMTISHEVVRDA